MRSSSVARVNRSKSLGISSAAFAGVPCLEFDMDYILDSLLISSYLFLSLYYYYLYNHSTYNYNLYHIYTEILNKDNFNSVFIASGKYEFKMGLGVVSRRSPSAPLFPSAPLSVPH